MLVELVRSMEPAERAGALRALDACTRPLSMREIETALRLAGVSKARAVLMAAALKRVAIVAVENEQ